MRTSERRIYTRNTPMNAYYYLAIAICAEVIATVSMKAVKGLSTPIPLLLIIVGYGIAFWMLTLVVRTVPVGVAYAVWAGMGIVMGSIAALFLYGQKLDIPAMLGMALIVLGVVVIQLFSKTAGH
jgi:small multidrug resistance pump